MINTEFNNFLSLFDRWRDAVKLSQEWHNDIIWSIHNHLPLSQNWSSSCNAEEVKIQLEKIETFKFKPLQDEIRGNLYQILEDVRENYVRELIMEFLFMYQYFSPSSLDENEIDLKIPAARIVPGKKVINLIWNEYQNGKQISDDNIIKYITKCICLYLTFLEHLDIICIGFEIDIEWIQEKHNIKVRNTRNYTLLEIDGSLNFDYVKDIEKRHNKDILDNVVAKSANTTRAKKVSFKNFKDIFISDDAYQKAFKELKKKEGSKNGFLIDDSVIRFFDKSSCVRVILALQYFGYTRKNTFYTGEELSDIAALLNNNISVSYANKCKSEEINNLSLQLTPYSC